MRVPDRASGIWVKENHVHSDTLSSVFECPSCREPLSSIAVDERDGRLQTGALECAKCHVSVPVLHGFPVFHEQLLGGEDPEDELRRLDERLFGSRREYESFLRAKRRRPSIDLYAAFRPFNESTRAIDPMIDFLRERLRPGDILLDLWCRTGWTGELLSSTFPEQHVVSVWESGSDVLGYRGFGYWLDEAHRRPNWDLVFHNPDDPLPFRDDAFAVVHGLDTIHRYRHQPLIPDCLRVCRADGVLVFPHIHLTNSEPEPFFERGEIQLHGTHWKKYFDQALEGTGRQSFVMSEKRLFEEVAGTLLSDEPDMEHYNACLVVAPEGNDGRSLAESEPAFDPDAYVIINPLLDVDLSTGVAEVETTGMLAGVRDLLDRHPMYGDRLDRYFPMTLERVDREILYHALRLKTVGEIAEILGLEATEIHRRLRALEKTDFVRLQAVSFSMAQLQQYYATQRVIPHESETTLGHLFRSAVDLSGEAPFLVWAEDGSVFSYEDTDTIVRKVAAFFASKGVGEGDRVLIHAVSHPEFFFAFWGAVLLGATAVPIDPGLSGDRMAHVLGDLRPRIAVLMHEVDGVECPAFAMSAEEDEAPYPSFFEGVADEPEMEDLPTTRPDQPAAILFTSGSTGTPKGVVLSHAGLFRSSELIDRVYAWRDSDRFFASGTPHTMSGLRNTCITPLHAGASVVLAPTDRGPLGILETCVEHEVTLLNTTPAFLAYCVQLKDKIRDFGDHRIRAVLCTGSALHAGLQSDFESVMGCPIRDYYGLTETSGACIFVPEEETKEPGIGRPIGAITAILDENGNEAEEGELAIYSDALALGYMTSEGYEPNPRVRGGYFHTGDLARRNDEGCIVLLGRQDGMLIDRGGENIYPAEIERALDRIEGVLACHATSHENGGFDHLAAIVVRDRDVVGDREGWTDAIREGLRGVLAPAHVPSILIEVDEVPVGTSGKWDPESVRNILENHR